MTYSRSYVHHRCLLPKQMWFCTLGWAGRRGRKIYQLPTVGFGLCLGFTAAEAATAILACWRSTAAVSTELDGTPRLFPRRSTDNRGYSTGYRGPSMGFHGHSMGFHGRPRNTVEAHGTRHGNFHGNLHGKSRPSAAIEVPRSSTAISVQSL